jgi:hypothetical protein
MSWLPHLSSEGTFLPQSGDFGGIRHEKRSLSGVADHATHLGYHFPGIEWFAEKPAAGGKIRL